MGTTTRRFLSLAMVLLFLASPLSNAAAQRNGDIAFVYRGAIWLAQPDGSRVRRIAGDFRSKAYYEIAAAPDGRRLLALDANSAIVVLGQGGSVRKTLIPGSRSAPTAADFVWSPSGKQVAIDVVQGVAGQFVIETIRVQDGRHRTVSEGVYPSWTPDGRSIVYLSLGPLGTDPRQDKLRSVSLADGRSRTIASDLSSPSLSPDGRRVAFISEEREDLMVMRADGTGRRVLARAGKSFVYALPTWSPDGRFILVKRDFGTRPHEKCCRSELWSLGISDGHWDKIRDRTDQIVRAAWLPNPRSS